MQENLFNKYELASAPNRIKSERAELVEKFVVRLNEARRNTKYAPLTARAVAVKLGHIPTGDLYAFLRQCEQARCFSSYFWWALKPQ